MATFQVPVGISGRHVHLTQEHIEVLFGKDYELTIAKELSQPGQFASEETVTLIGNKGSISGVRVLGPARKQTQVELSTTDTFKLGIKAPVRDSGDLDGTPGINIQGPNGKIHIETGVIIASRHIHMSILDAKKYNLKDGDHVKVQIPGPRGGVLDHVLIRASSNYALDMHVDTDEGNAFNIHNGDLANVISDRLTLVAK